MKKYKHINGWIGYTFTDTHKQICSIQDSSVATFEGLWLGIDSGLSGIENARMHLNIKLAKQLIKKLQQFVDDGHLGSWKSK
ncbi:MAG TPA: hypothetical protein PLO52_00395 [Flavobacterium alvei]|nr:hypothetical protein [Flavobacterium alvei]